MPRFKNKEFDRLWGRKIKERRTVAGLTQEKLANKIGITHQQQQKYEDGTNQVSLALLNEIAYMLDWAEVKEFFSGQKVLAIPEDFEKNTLVLQASRNLYKLAGKNERSLQAVCRLVHDLTKEEKK